VRWARRRAEGNSIGAGAAVEPLESRALLSFTPGPEFMVSASPLGEQVVDSRVGQAVAMDADGDTVIVFRDEFGDGSNTCIKARRYNAAGVAQGAPLVVNATAQNAQGYASVAMDDDGDFVVAWATTSVIGNSRIDGRVFNRNGEPVGGEFEVTAGASFGNANDEIAIAMDADGDFVVAWSGFVNGAAILGIHGRRFNAAGQPKGDEFQIDDAGGDRHSTPGLAMDAAGNFIATWREQADATVSVGDVYLRRFDASGDPIGGHVKLNPDGVSAGGARPMMAADGRFAVAYNLTGIGPAAQRFTAAGAPAGAPIQVAPLGYGATSASMNAAGEFLIVFAFRDPTTSDDVYGRRFDAEGRPVGDLFRANTFTSYNQRFSSGAIDDAGDFVIAWTSENLTGDATQDGSGAGAFARRWTAVPPPAAAIVGRHVFYNHSSFDGNDAAMNPADDDAIATDKVALRPGQAASFANVTSYSRGINGMMFDVSGRVPLTALVGLAANVGLKAGTGGDPATWPDAPRPSQIGVRPGAGVNGTERVTLVWPDEAIVNKWLRVSIPAMPEFGMAAGDVFCFGNLPGDTGNGSTLVVNGLDLLAVRRKFFTSASVTSPFDFDRDGRVGAADFSVARANYLRGLTGVAAPSAPVEAGGDRHDRVASGVLK
jgi:hypothetical protein